MEVDMFDSPVFVYLLTVAGLWYASQLILTKGFKPMILHRLRDQFFYDEKKKWKSDNYEQGYTFLVQAVLFVIALGVAAPFQLQLDFFGRWGWELTMPFGLEFSPWYGVVVSCLAAVFVGERLHDFFKENNVAIPLLKITRKVPDAPAAAA
jgi:hypothetical protein